MAASGGADAIDDFRQDRRVSIRTDRWMFHADSVHIGGKEDLCIAELRLNSRVPFGALSDLIQRSVTERRCKVSGRRHEPIIGKKSTVLGGYKSAGGSAWIALNGVLAISEKAWRRTGTERSNPLSVSTHGSGFKAILAWLVIGGFPSRLAGQPLLR